MHRVTTEKNQLTFYAHATEVQNFFNRTDNLDKWSKNLEPMYLRACRQLNLFGKEVDCVEKITPLEIAARDNKPEHLKAILFPASINSNSLLSSMASFLSAKWISSSRIHPVESHEEKQPVEAFFRALTKGHSDIAQILLGLPDVNAKAAKIHITPISCSDAFSPYKSYIERIQRPNRYRRLSLQLPNNGNLALILAAQSGDSVIFFRLLALEIFRNQLPQSGIQAFLCATTTRDGSNIEKHLLKMDIIDYLLECPVVFSFVHSRAFDFAFLLEDFMKKRLKELHDDSDVIDAMTTNEIQLCIYFILYLVEYKPAFALTEIEFLLGIESVKQMAHSLQRSELYPSINNKQGLWHWAIQHQNKEVMDLLMEKMPNLVDKQIHSASLLPFFKPKPLAINLPHYSETDLSTLAPSPWSSEMDMASRGVSALTIDVNRSVTPLPSMDEFVSIGEMLPF